MENINITDMIKELERIREQNSKLEYIKKNYVNYSDKLIEISMKMREFADQIKGLALQIDPVKNMDIGNRKKNTSYKEWINELMEKMRTGTTVDRNLIQAAYQCEDSMVSNVMQRLKTMPTVKSRKDGGKLYLYI